MPEERKIEIAIAATPEETRTGELTRVLEAAGFGVHSPASASTMVILVLPGRGGAALLSTCLEIARTFPSTPAIVLHTPVAGEYCSFVTTGFVFDLSGGRATY